MIMQGYDSRYWLELIFRRRATALQVGGVVFGLIVLGTLLWPPVYNSTAKILVQDNRAQYLVSPDLQNASPQKPTAVANPVNEEALNSEVELLTSTFLIKHALANLPEPSDFSTPTGVLMSAFDSAMDLPVLGYNALHDTPTLTSRDQWALKLERHLSAFVVKRSDIIEVGFNAHDPKWSKDFLERLLNEYLAYHARLSQDPEAQKFFQTQSQQLQKQLEGSEEKLRAFEVQNGITDLPAQKLALVNRLSGLQAQYEKVTAEVASAHEQTSTLAGELRDTPERIAKETRSVQNLALQNLKPQIAQLQAERGELLSRYQPTSQRIQQIDAKLAAAQRILNQENHLEVQEKSTDLNPVWVTVDSNLERSRTNQAAVDAGQKTLSDEIRAGRDELTQMVNNAVVVDRLERQVANDKEAYLSFVRKAEEARTAEALNLNKILNVSVAQPPTMPLRPIFPKVWLNLIAGLVLAAGLGIGAAYLEEMQDERIYSAATIGDVSGLATVAVLPERN
jgi:uncharacterized protein involved in exopolysaccharide biosynthesis